MVHGNLFDRADLIKHKQLKDGSPNPRYVTALRETKAAKVRLKDLVGNYKILSKAQIAREYTPERVEALLAAGNENLARMRAPLSRPGWMPEE